MTDRIAGGLPTSDERRQAAYVVSSLPATLKLAFIREVGRQIGYRVEREAAAPASLAGWTFRDPSGAGFCSRCHLPIEVHPLDEDGVDVDRCPDQPARLTPSADPSELASQSPSQSRPRRMGTDGGVS
jgi:hypothetical protein